MTATPLVLSDRLMRRFEDGTVALDGLEFQVEPGRVTGLVGPDGAGKTTLMRIMAGLLLPTEGTIRVCGYSTLTELPALRQAVSYMPQRFGLYEDLSVAENLAFHADLRGVVGRAGRVPPNACWHSPAWDHSPTGWRAGSPAV